MALPPSLWSPRLIDQNFGMCITPEDFILPFYNTFNTNYYRPWKWCPQNIVKDFGSTVDNQRDNFKVTLDVQHFQPNEVSVKVANNQIIVEGRHEERKDEHGFVSRHFTRRYALPNDCMPEDVTSNLSTDGILTVAAKKKSANELETNEKIVPIKLCKSCPMVEKTTIKNGTHTDQKEKTEEIKKVDATKKNAQIILKDDHCCLLLKPELLRDAASDSTDKKIEKKKEKVEFEQVKEAEQASKNTSEILEQTFNKSSAVTSVGISESIRGSVDISEQVCDTTTASISTSADKQSSAKTSMGVAKSSKEIGQSSMASSQMSELATSSKASECMESSTYMSSLTSSIKEMSDDLSDFVSDILCSELDDNEEIKEFKNKF